MMRAKFVDLDAFVERLVRNVAQKTSRRSFLARAGALLCAAPALPLLPMARARADSPPEPSAPHTEFERHAQAKDDRECTYWRYCAVDGHLCSCCGGGIHSCPPGSTPSPTAWIGTCLNPVDNLSYLIVYRDCCGKQACGQCACDNSDRETPIYRPQGNNDILWCIGLSSMTYHCTTAVMVGKAP